MGFFKNHSNKKIFLDFAAGRSNPSAIYDEGIEAKREIEESRTQIAHELSIGAKDIIFTSGGTESDNLAILGTFEYFKNKIKNPHIIISGSEHPAVLESAKEAEMRGAVLSIVNPDDEGLISPEEIKKLMSESTILVSVSLVNGETGVIQPISKIGRVVREFRKGQETIYPYLHTDASQAAVCLPLSMESLHADLMTLDSSKTFGPKGIGLLGKRANVSISPIIFGGGQERGLRPGTENISAIKGFSNALLQINTDKEKNNQILKKLKDVFIQEIHKKIPQAEINGSEEYSVPNIISITIPGALHEFLAVKLAHKGVFVSTGSSCKANKNNMEQEAIRFSFSPTTKKEEIIAAVEIFSKLL